MQTNSPSRSIPFKFTPVKNAFAHPGGAYRARLDTVRKRPCKHDPSKELTRFAFSLLADQSGPVEYLNKRDYTDSSKDQAQLQKDLAAFFKPEEIAKMRRAGTEIELFELEGKEVDLMITTSVSPHYPDPFSKIEGIYPAGHLLSRTDAEADFCELDATI